MNTFSTAKGLPAIFRLVQVTSSPFAQPVHLQLSSSSDHQAQHPALIISRSTAEAGPLRQVTFQSLPLLPLRLFAFA
jgi:hypothetical protein